MSRSESAALDPYKATDKRALIDADFSEYGGGAGKRDRDGRSSSLAKVGFASKDSLLGPGGRLLRKCMVGLNVFFILCGLIILILSAYARNNEISSIVPSFTTLGICVGAFVFVFAALGLCGTQRESTCILKMYLVLTVIVLLILISAGSYIASKKGKEDDIVQTGWDHLANDARVSLQNKYSCCGLRTFNDTAGMPCPDPIKTPESLRPCMELLVDAFKSSFNAFGVCGLVLGLVMIAAAVGSGCLARSIRLAGERDAAMSDGRDDRFRKHWI